MNKNNISIFILSFLTIINPLFVQLSYFNQTDSSNITLLFISFVCLFIFLVLFKFLDNTKVRNIYISFLIAFHFDLQLNFSSKIYNYLSLNKFQLLFVDIFFFLLILTTVYFALKKIKYFLNIFLIFLITSSVSLLFVENNSNFISFDKSKNQIQSFNNQKEIYIMFDGLTGTESIEDIQLSSGMDVLEKIKKVQDEYKLRSFDKAYSIFNHTHYTMSHLFNFDYKNENNIKQYLDLQKNMLLENKFFDLKSKSKINVFQTDQLNFCAHDSVVKCRTFNPYEKRYIKNNSDFLSIETKHIIQNFNAALQNSSLSKYIVTFFIKIINFIEKEEIRLNAAYYSKNFSDWFDFFSDQVVQASNENIFFAHFMVPHEPYFLNRDCEFIDNVENRTHYKWKLHFKDDDDFEFLAKQSSEFYKNKQKIFDTYLQQTGCVYNKILDLLNKMEKFGILESSSIFIFGDHGSRISKGLHYDSSNKEDILHNHSTAFFYRNFDNSDINTNKEISIQSIFSHLINNEKLIYDNNVSLKVRDKDEFKFKSYK